MRLFYRKIFLVLGFLVFLLLLIFFFKYSALLATQITIDNSVSTTTTEHIGAQSTTVFTSDTTGYSFYVDSDGAVKYSKTTDSGATWGAAVTMDAQTDALGVAVWYDRWTPNDTTGTLIHVLTWDSGSSDLWYESLNTSGDTQSGVIAISSAPGPALTNSLTAGTVAGTITKGENGILYAGIVDSSSSYVLRCSTTCATASNWTQTATPTFTNADNDWLLLTPYSSNDIMAIWWDQSANDMLTKVYEDGAGTWPGAWTTVDLDADVNTTYDAPFGAVTNNSNYNVYLTYVDDASSLGPNNDDIENWTYNGSWTQNANIITNDAFRGITSSGIARDTNSGDIYVVYSASTDPDYSATIHYAQSVYYRVSRDNMATWSSEIGPINTESDEIYGVRTNLMSADRLYTSWYSAFPDDLFGHTISNIQTGVDRIYIGTSGTQTNNITNNTANNYIGAAFTLIRNTGTGNITSITVNEEGTMNANTSLSNLDIYYETAGTCTYNGDGSETLFGTDTAFDGSDIATVTGTMAVGTSQVCVYLIFDIAADAYGTIDFEISDPSSDILVSSGYLTISGDVKLNETTNTRQANFTLNEVGIDTSASTVALENSNTDSSIVFIDDQTGYAFYVDSDGAAKYSKTTNGGTSWGAAVTMDAQTDVEGIAVWYDQWTPNDTTGTLIHVLTFDSGSDDLWYESLNTSGDTQSGVVAISSTPGPVLTNTFASGNNNGSITKGENGILYAGIIDQTASYILRCSTTCSTASNWTQTATATFAASDNDWLMLRPYSNNDIIAIWWDSSVDDILTKVYEDGAGTWPGAWTTVDANADENLIFDGTFEAITNPSNYNVYLAYVDDASFVTDTATDDIKTWVYNGSWTATSNVLTNDVRGVTDLALGYDSLKGEVYAFYSVITDLQNLGTQNIYFKTSTNAMTTWSSEKGGLPQTSDNFIYGLDTNYISSHRLFAVWADANLDDFLGQTGADIHRLTQKAYRFFNNNNSTDVGSALASQDTPATLGSTGSAFRLRILGEITSSQINTSTNYYKLQYAGKGSGSCSSPTGGTPATYTDVTTSTLIAFNNNASPADGATLTANGNDPTDGGNTIINQTYEESNPFTNSVAGISTSQDGKWDFSLIDNGAPAGTTYCFRVVEFDNDAVYAYSSYPEVTTASAGADLTQSHFRWRNDNGVENNWYNSSWSNRVSISIDDAQVDSDLTDFPVYVNLANLPASFFSNVQGDGEDIRVTTSNGSTEVPIELVNINTSGAPSCASNCTGELYFKAPSISNTVDTKFYIYYGNSGASGYTTNATYGRDNVWTNNFEGVWHLNEDPSTAGANGIIDSSGNARHGTDTGSMTSGDRVSGQLGNALDFDGTDDHINLADNIFDALTVGTVSVWFDFVANGTVSSLFGMGDDFYLLQKESDETFSIYTNCGLIVKATNTLSSGFNHAVLAIGASSNELYLAGAPATKSYTSGNAGTGVFFNDCLGAGTNSYDIGHTPDYAGEYFQGVIDELRVSSVERTASWIDAEYANQNTPTSFYNVGNIENYAELATWAANEDTQLTNLEKNTNIRLRFLVSNEGSATSSAVSYRLEVSEANPSSCGAGTYTRLDSDANWDHSASTYFTDGETTTNVASGLTDENTTFLPGLMEETSDTLNSSITLTSTQFTELEYSIKATSSATSGATYCFRLTDAGSAIDTYTNYASAVIANNSISFTISDNTIGFGSLSSSDDRFATGDTTGSSTETAAHTFTAATTASSGYTIQIYGPTLTSGGNTITQIGGTSASSSIGSEQFGMRYTASGGVGTVSSPYNSGTQYAYDGVTVADTIASALSGDNVNTTYTSYYICNINGLTEAGSYSTTLNYIMTANF